jgi:hypothetical protein
MKIKIIPLLLLTLLLAGCPFDGDNGSNGSSGINCWDLNGDRVNDSNEDINKDGLWDSHDCTVVSDSTQNQKAELNHQHICEALANLGEYPEGCPSNSHTVPTGTLTKMTNITFFDDGTGNKLESCANSPSNGLLSISLRDFVNSDGNTVKQGWYELEGGYIVSKSTMPLIDAVNGQCSTQCSADSDCIAALAVKQSSQASSCRLFYHSDTVGTYERVCGLDIPGFTASEQCLIGLGSGAIWASKCP